MDKVFREVQFILELLKCIAMGVALGAVCCVMVGAAFIGVMELYIAALEAL